MVSDAKQQQKQSFQFVVVGGGIAGVTCVERLCQRLPSASVALVTAAPHVKTVHNFRQVSKTLEEFEVAERPSGTLAERYPNLTVVSSAAASLRARARTLLTADGLELGYGRLCICSGARPKILTGGDRNPYVLGIRDTDSARRFQERLSGARRITVVGNGGIALELVYEVRGCEVVWVVKDDAIGNTFFDAGAARFLVPSLDEDKAEAAREDATAATKRVRYTVEPTPGPSSRKKPDAEPGSALGPDWHQGIAALRGVGGAGQQRRRVSVEYGCEVDKIYGPGEGEETPEGDVSETRRGQGSWPVYVRLSNGKTVGCDLVVSATGVLPNTEPFLPGNRLALHTADGGLRVDRRMATSEPGIYAAGDVCSALWGEEEECDGGPRLWQQMRLWSQARQMGWHAANCMVSADSDSKQQPELDFCFELFAHVTRFLGHKVVLLGRFNGQGLAPGDQELLVRCSPGLEYVKVVLSGGRMVGTVLIGDTDLEETLENLMLNRMDLTAYREELLNPNIHIEDYFD